MILLLFFLGSEGCEHVRGGRGPHEVHQVRTPRSREARHGQRAHARALRGSPGGIVVIFDSAHKPKILLRLAVILCDKVTAIEPFVCCWPHTGWHEICYCFMAVVSQIYT